MKNKFDSKISIIGGVVFFIFFSLACTSFLVYWLLLNDSQFNDIIMRYIDRGKGTNIKSSAVISIIYTYLGRNGCIAFMFLGTLLMYNELFKEIQTLRRYLRKEKLFKMGLVSDMNDDEKPKGLIGSIRQLFCKSKSSSAFASQYSRRRLRKMKKELNEIEKRQKRRKRIR